MAHFLGPQPQNEHERRVYQALAELNNEYMVIPNIHWLRAEQTIGGIHPDRGFLVIEVKGLDSKNSTITYNAKTKKFQHKPSNFSKNPQTQVEVSCTRLKSFLSDPLELANVAVSPLLWFPSSPRKSLALTDDIGIFVLSKDECDDPQKAVAYIQQVVFGSPYHRVQHTPLDPSAMSVITDRLKSQLSHTVTEGQVNATNLDMFRKISRQFLDARSEDILRTTRCHIIGGAGTGKTVLAYKMAARFHNASLKTVFVCSHENQRNWLINEAYFRQMYPTKTMFPILKRSELVDQGKFDVIIVDEAQDIPNGYWPTLRSYLSSPTDGILYAFRDDSQRTVEEKWNPLNLGQLCPTIELSTNLRNAQIIYRLMRTQNPRLKERENDELFPLGKIEFIGVTPMKKQPFEEKEAQELNAILAGLVGKVALDTILLISCRIQDPHGATQQSRFYQRGALEKETHPMRLFSSPYVSGHIRVTTINAAKGLESDIVILTEIDGLKKAGKVRENLVYIGISRARSHLIVLGNPKDDAWLKAAMVNAGKPVST